MAEKVQHDPERRRYPRVEAKVPVELLCSGTAPMRTVTNEISLCGCYIETMFTMEVGTNLSLILFLKDQRIKLTGVIATKYPQVGNGIDFIEIDPHDRVTLREFIANCEDENYLTTDRS